MPNQEPVAFGKDFLLKVENLSQNNPNASSPVKAAIFDFAKRLNGKIDPAWFATSMTIYLEDIKDGVNTFNQEPMPEEKF